MVSGVARNRNSNATGYKFVAKSEAPIFRYMRAFERPLQHTTLRRQY